MSLRNVFLASVCSAFLAASAAVPGSAAATSDSKLVSQAYKALQVGDAASAVTAYSQAIESRNLEPEMLAMIEEAERLTAANTALTLVVAFNYGARAEITMAARKLAQHVAAGELTLADITEARLADCLETRGIPDPELLIRTSGELRLSNFLLWQAAYTEFVFVEAFWPDFGRELLEQAIAIYHSRDRRFGGLTKRSSA